MGNPQVTEIKQFDRVLVTLRVFRGVSDWSSLETSGEVLERVFADVSCYDHKGAIIETRPGYRYTIRMDGTGEIRGIDDYQVRALRWQELPASNAVPSVARSARGSASSGGG